MYEIQSVTVAEGQAPVVTFRALNADGQPFDLVAEMTATPRRINPTFVLSRLGADGKYTSYLTRTSNGASFGAGQTPALASAIQATSESAAPARISGGTDGVYTYTFAAPVTGVDPAATHRAGMWGTRTFQERTYPASTTFDFRPDGGAATQREVVSDAACNRCHTVVNAHGGARRGVNLCLTCHSPQTVDPETGNNVDMALMIHKIHKGRLLANGYTIIGNRQSIHDFSHVAMGPSHNTYFETTLAPGAPAGTPLNASSDRGIIRECALCHQGAQAQSIETNLSTTTCTTCHDDVNPGLTPVVQNGTVTVAPGVGHPIGSFPDTACSTCHSPGGALGNTVAVPFVHSPNYETTRNLLFATHTFALKIDAVNNVVSGGATPPSVDFTLTLDGAPFDARANQANLGALAFQIAGPITDYAENIPTTTTNTTPSGGSVQSGLTSGALNSRVTDIDAAAGKFRFTFEPAAAGTPVIPAGRTGVYVVAFESYYKEPQTGADQNQVSKPFAADPVFRGAEKNVAYVNIANGEASTTERRLIVSNAKCNNCHEDIGFHSNRSRQGVDYCATCHNPNLSNATRARFQPADLVNVPGIATPVFVVESVSTNVFIHKIHMGAELSRPYRLGANRTATDPTPGGDGLADFSQFEAPSPMGNCQTCHEGETYVLPQTPNLLPVRQAILDCGTPVADSTGAEWCSGRTANTTQGVRYTPPQQAVCAGCHDTDAAKAHFDLNTIYPIGQTAATYNPYNVVGGTGAPRPPSPAEDGSVLPDPARSAIESCATCHGAGRDFDVVSMHPPVLLPTVDLELDTP